MTDRCRYCGNEIHTNSAYCSYCGAPTKKHNLKVTPSAPDHSIPQSGESQRINAIPGIQFKKDQVIEPEVLPPKRNFGQRLVTVVKEPDGFFKYLNLRSDLRGAFLVFSIGLVLTVMASLVLFSKITFTGDLSTIFPELGTIGITGEELTDLLAGLLPAVLLVSTIFGALIGLPVSAVIYWIIAKIFGGTGSIRKTVEFVGYASLPLWISGIYNLIMAYLSPAAIINLELMSLDALAFTAGSPLVSFLLTSLLGLWQAILISYGLHHIHKIPIKKSMTIGVGLWLILTLLNFVPVPLI